MAFPLSVEGTVIVQKEANLKDVAQVKNRLEIMLKSVSATDISSTDESVKFHGGIFRVVTNWNILVSFESGLIHVSEDQENFFISYVNKTKQLCIIVSCIIAFILFSTESRSNESHNSSVCVFAIFGWLWLVGGNYVLSSFRFPRWLERGLKAESR